MRFWANLIGYQLVWFAAVIGASLGHAWWGVGAGAAFVFAQAWASECRRADLRLAAVALYLGMTVDGILAASGWAQYAMPRPALPLGGAPIWILALWASFAMTFNHSLVVFRDRHVLAGALGLVGGPLVYWGAARGWGAISFTAPAWRGLTWLALSWAVSMVVLCRLARRWERNLRRVPDSLSRGAQ